MTTRPGYIWSGTEWVSIGQEAVVAPVSYQASAPSTPSTGDIWIDSNDDVPGIDTSQFLRWRKTAVGGETSVSGTDDNGLTLQYTANYEQVYLNGVCLVRGQDYTATYGTSITGLTALAANDVVEVFGVVARVVGDVYTQAQTNSLLDAKSNVSTTGAVLLNTTTFTSTSSINVNNVFNSSYENYLIMFNITGAANNGYCDFQLSTGGTASAASYYYAWQGINTSNTSINATNANVGSMLFAEFNASNTSTGVVMYMYRPFIAAYTTLSAQFIQTQSNVTKIIQGGCEHRVATSYDGFKVLPSQAITGTIRIYGMK